MDVDLFLCIILSFNFNFLILNIWTLLWANINLLTSDQPIRKWVKSFLLRAKRQDPQIESWLIDIQIIKMALPSKWPSWERPFLMPFRKTKPWKKGTLNLRLSLLQWSLIWHLSNYKWPSSLIEKKSHFFKDQNPFDITLLQFSL